MVNIKASRIIDNEREVLVQLAHALAGKLGVDKEGYLWLCNVRIGKTAKDESGETIIVG
jgi:hypothetical protein